MKKIVLATCIILSGVVHAQVSYTDVIPDKKITQNEIVKIHLAYPIGTTSSGPITTTDSAMMLSYTASIRIVRVSVDGNNFEFLNTASSADTNEPAALDAGTIINEAAGTWTKGPSIVRTLNENGQHNWVGAMDKYLGVRFKRNNQWHYGWVQLSIDNYATYVTIHGYAYEKQPLTAIAAGAKTSSIGSGPHSPLFSGITLQGKTLVISNLPANTRVSVTDMSGRMLSSESAGKTKYTRNMSQYPPGIYIIHLESASATSAFKIYIP